MSSRASGKRRGAPRAGSPTPLATRRRRTAAYVTLGLLVAAATWAVAGAPIPGRSESPATTAADPLDGRALYVTHCASCHGERGEGQPDWKTKKADGTYPAPPHDPSGHTWHHADGLLFRIVRDGGQVAGGPGIRSAMPAWKDTLTDAQIRATLEYVKTLWGPAERKAQANASVSDPYP